jgi:hypothetical protein
MADSWWPWILRATWVILPFTLGPLIGDAVADASRPVQVTATLGAWVLWGAGMVLTSIPHTVTLTPMRILGPGTLATAIVATVADGASAAAVAALANGAAVAVVALSPALGAWFVNGSSYGDERRAPLRPPAAMLAGPIPFAWVVIVAVVLALPLLLAARGWVGAAIVAVAGIPAAVIGTRALHRLAHRWLVFVPAGVVVHDALAVPDPVLLKRTAIHSFGPALADTGAVDLTMGTTGLVLEIQLNDMAEVAHRVTPRGEPVNTELTALLVAPTRPGVVLDEAKRRSITVA